LEIAADHRLYFFQSGGSEGEIERAALQAPNAIDAKFNERLLSKQAR
jgi:hypothetical protein